MTSDSLRDAIAICAAASAQQPAVVAELLAPYVERGPARDLAMWLVCLATVGASELAAMLSQDTAELWDALAVSAGES